MGSGGGRGQHVGLPSKNGVGAWSEELWSVVMDAQIDTTCNPYHTL